MKNVINELQGKGKYWISFVGDSITSTEWVHPNWREIVEYVLKNELSDKFADWKVPSWGIRCFNFGLDGSTSTDILDRFDEILMVESNMMVLMIGANDPTQGVDVETHRSNILKIIKMAKEKSVELWLSTCNKAWNETSNRLCLPFVEIDRDLNLDYFIDMYQESDKFPKDRIYTFQSETNIPEEGIKKGDLDFWHPNQLGNAYIAKVILDKIWGIKFDPEKYIQTNRDGYKMPEY